MKSKRKWGVIFLLILSVVALFAGGNYYITGVKNALWKKAVTDILEVTVQGRHALDTYIEKDKETLHLLVSELEKEASGDYNTLQRNINIFSEEGDSYTCVDLQTGAIYSDLLQERYTVQGEQLELFRSRQGKGVREPFLHERTGVKTIGVYERFRFADGVEGYVQKAQPLSKLSERFSLSFYNDTGFSYVVSPTGDILIRSQHRNSNRTFQNLFDIIDLQGNDVQELNAFRAALKSGKRGVAYFQYKEESYVFCYVPMKSVTDWYVVSIIPDRVIMEQANAIVQHSQLLFILILASVLLIALFFLIYWNSMRRMLLAEEEARRAAESANVAKSRFLSNMSHDIRTPVNAITSMAKLAADHVEDSEKVKEYLKNIGLSGQLLVGLINDILDMSKIESGKMVLNNETTSLETLLTNIVNIIQPMLSKKRQSFDIRLHAVEHETLCFDSLRLNQILINLLSNSIKYTPEEGSISMDVTEHAPRKEGYAHLTFRVADNGIGMKPEFLEHIFDSFTREQDSRTNKIEGTGLGMAITKMIVDIMEGTIGVESKLGEGSVFTVTLDLLLPADVPELQIQAEMSDMRILVADDDVYTGESIEKILHKLGTDADIVESGQKAVEKATEAHSQKRDYSLILVDWKMPDKDGVQVVREIRKEIGEQIPIVIFSAYDWTRIQTEAIAAGATGFLQKPFFMSTLSRCIRRYVLREDISEGRQPEQVKLTGKRILLAEDNEINQEIAVELLEEAGARVEVTVNGLACVERFKSSKPGYFDLILMDIQMPLMNGYEATKQIRNLKREDASTVPIFAMTADAFAEDIEAAKEAGMNSHLAKPLDIPAMMREIQKYLI